MNDALIAHIHTHIIPAALALLPGQLSSPEARAMLLAIGCQESAFEHRRQKNNGPARGFYQFERGGGVAGVLSHPLTGPLIRPVCATLRILPTPPSCHLAIQYNDVLATCFARLLLWSVPQRLPLPHEAQEGWDLYIDGWRPGKPHRETWDAHFAHAWRVVEEGRQ